MPSLCHLCFIRLKHYSASRKSAENKISAAVEFSFGPFGGVVKFAKPPKLLNCICRNGRIKARVQLKGNRNETERKRKEIWNSRPIETVLKQIWNRYETAKEAWWLASSSLFLFQSCFRSVSGLFLFPFCFISVSFLFPFCFLSVSFLFHFCFIFVSFQLHACPKP